MESPSTCTLVQCQWIQNEHIAETMESIDGRESAGGPVVSKENLTFSRAEYFHNSAKCLEERGKDSSADAGSYVAPVTHL